VPIRTPSMMLFLRKTAKGYELAKGKRTTTGPYSPDYRSGSDMRRTLEAAILDKAYGIYLELQRATKQEKERAR